MRFLIDFVLVQLFIAIFVCFYSDQIHLISHVKFFDYVIGFFTGVGIGSTYYFFSGLIRKK